MYRLFIRFVACSTIMACSSQEKRSIHLVLSPQNNAAAYEVLHHIEKYRTENDIGIDTLGNPDDLAEKKLKKFTCLPFIPPDHI